MKPSLIPSKNSCLLFTGLGAMSAKLLKLIRFHQITIKSTATICTKGNAVYTVLNIEIYIQIQLTLNL